MDHQQESELTNGTGCIPWKGKHSQQIHQFAKIPLVDTDEVTTSRFFQTTEAGKVVTPKVFNESLKF
jgi:hypothetical protein